MSHPSDTAAPTPAERTARSSWVTLAKVLSYSTVPVMTLVWLLMPVAYGDIPDVAPPDIPPGLIETAALVLVCGAVAMVGVLLLPRAASGLRYSGAGLAGAVWGLGLITLLRFDAERVGYSGSGDNLLWFLHLLSLVPVAALAYLTWGRRPRRAASVGSSASGSSESWTGPLGRMVSEGRLGAMSDPDQPTYRAPDTGRGVGPETAAAPAADPATDPAMTGSQNGLISSADAATPAGASVPREEAAEPVPMKVTPVTEFDVSDFVDALRLLVYPTGAYLLVFVILSALTEEKSSLGAWPSLVLGMVLGVAVALGVVMVLPRVYPTKILPLANVARGTFIAVSVLACLAIYTGTGGDGAAMRQQLLVVVPLLTLPVIGGVMLWRYTWRLSNEPVGNFSDRVVLQYGEWESNAGGGAHCNDLVRATQNATKKESRDEARKRLYARARERHCGSCMGWVNDLQYRRNR